MVYYNLGVSFDFRLYQLWSQHQRKTINKAMIWVVNKLEPVSKDTWNVAHNHSLQRETVSMDESGWSSQCLVELTFNDLAAVWSLSNSFGEYNSGGK